MTAAVLDLATRYYKNIEAVYGSSAGRVCAVLNLRTRSVYMGLADAIWQKYPLGEDAKVMDPGTGASARRNVDIRISAAKAAQGYGSLEDLQARGAIFLICGFALEHLAKRLATPVNAQGDDVHTELRPDLDDRVPGVLLLHGYSSSKEVLSNTVGVALALRGIASRAILRYGAHMLLVSLLPGSSIAEVEITIPNAAQIRFNMVVQSLNRPYPVSGSMIALASLVPLYIFIARFVKDGALHAPALALDRAIPLQSAWVIVYGSLYLFLIILPVFVVRQDEHIRRTVFAYLTVWILAYFCFLIYPTVAPRPASVLGQGFFVWALKGLYSADPPYNCFPSIHVAHSFVSAFTCYRVNRKVGVFATICASLVAISTLFTKQHYVLDVIAGGALAYAAYLLFLRELRPESVPENDRDLAQTFTLAVLGLIGFGLACVGVAYKVWG